MLALSRTCSAALVAALLSAQAQLSSSGGAPDQPETVMRAQASPANIQAWLESKDPRLIAWGAYFARENNDLTGLATAAQLVRKSLDRGGPELFSEGAPQHDALSEVLDALIQRRVLLSAEMIGYVSRSHPAQAIILLSMLPAAERTENLTQWYYGARSSDGSNHLDRVSGMFLSKEPPPGFAANALKHSEERLTIYIVPKLFMGIRSRIGGGGCGSFALYRPPAGWPDIPSYHLTENDNSNVDPLLVEAGGDRIFWQRSIPGRGFRSCGGVEGLTPTTRHHLLAEMLKQPDKAMSWPEQKAIEIVKKSDEQVQRDIGSTLQKEQEVLLQSVQEFSTRGLITQEEAKTVLPKLSVVLHYE